MQQVSFSMVLNMLNEIQLSLLTEPSFLNVDGSGFILERALAPMAQKKNSGAGNFRMTGRPGARFSSQISIARSIHSIVIQSSMSK